MEEFEPQEWTERPLEAKVFDISSERVGRDLLCKGLVRKLRLIRFCDPGTGNCSSAFFNESMLN